MPSLLGGGSKSTTTTDNTPKVLAQLEPLLQPMASSALNAFSRSPTERIAPETATQIGARKSFADEYFGNNFGTSMDAAQDFVTGSAGNPRVRDFYNPFLQDVISATEDDLARNEAAARQGLKAPKPCGQHVVEGFQGHSEKTDRKSVV